MSIQPSLWVICGIADLQTDGWRITDPHWDGSREECWWRDEYPPLPQLVTDDNYINLSAEERRQCLRNDSIVYHLTFPKEPCGEPAPRSGKELIHWSTEYGCPEVVGYQLDRQYGETWLYALASVFPDFTQKGWCYLPSLPLERDHSHEAYLVRHRERKTLSQAELYDVQRKLKLLEFGWNCPYFDFTIEQHMVAAHYLLNWIGLKVEERELKPILYWEWS